MTDIVPRFEMTEEEIEAVIERDKSRIHNLVTNAQYDKKSDRVVLEFENGMCFMVPRSLLQGIADIPKGDPILKNITILGPGSAIAWDDVDIGFSVQELLEGIVGSRKWMKEVAARGGRAKTERKAASSRENGRKGGRPRKKAS